MEPSRRTTLILKIATFLSGQDLNDAELTMRQFGAPVKWSGRFYPHLIRTLEECPDEKLEALHAHVEGSGTSEQADPTPWEKGKFRLFLSHITTDLELVTATKTHLTKYAIDGFVAHSDIEPAADWIVTIEHALHTCDALVAFLTPEFHGSKWTDQEVGFCVQRRVLVIPIRLGVDPYGFIARYQALTPGRKPSAEEIASGLFAILASHALTCDRMADALIDEFVAATSFNDALQKKEMLDDVKTWTPARLRKIEESIGQNSQIRGAYGVPAKITRIVEDHNR